MGTKEQKNIHDARVIYVRARTGRKITSQTSHSQRERCFISSVGVPVDVWVRR